MICKLEVVSHSSTIGLGLGGNLCPAPTPDLPGTPSGLDFFLAVTAGAAFLFFTSRSFLALNHLAHPNCLLTMHQFGCILLLHGSSGISTLPNLYIVVHISCIIYYICRYTFKIFNPEGLYIYSIQKYHPTFE